MNLSFIKLDINIMNDTKIKLIRKMPDGDSILILWIGLLCLGMKSGKPGTLEIGDGIPFTDETLSIELDIPINTVRLGLQTFTKFKMIEVWEDGTTFLTNFEKHQELEKILTAKEKSRITSQRHRDRMKLTQSGDDHVIVSDKTDKEEDKDLDLEKELLLEQEFEKFWNLYGKKKDKTKCFNKWRKLKDSEKQEIFRTLPAYIRSTQDIQYRKNPQTYLNGKNWEDEYIGKDDRTDNEKFKDPNYYGPDSPITDESLF